MGVAVDHDYSLKAAATIQSGRDYYIPAGTLSISELWSRVPAHFCQPEELQDWSAFALASDARAPFSEVNGTPALPQPVQAVLFGLDELGPYIDLFQNRWIRLDFAISKNNHDVGLVRVHLLPEDVARSSIERSDRKLGKALHLLLTRLNFTKSAWNGQYEAGLPSPPLSENEHPKDENQSLLYMFNNIVSPVPKPEEVRNADAQSAIFALLESNVQGLETELYHYQRRSAAVMVQRETCPGMVLDPRLQERRDQNGVPWFYDSVAGTVLREARYYDGVSGGILAEEMGAGKTLICLALILATKHLRGKMLRGKDSFPARRRVGSLVDMAAASVTRHSIPWRLYFDDSSTPTNGAVDRRYEAIRRNPAYYNIYPHPRPRASVNSRADKPRAPRRVLLSHASLVIVPNNLMTQWDQEIRKHTSGLNIIAVSASQPDPQEQELIKADIVLFAQGRFEKLLGTASPLANIRFKRCIVDEGHRLGHSKMAARSNLLLMIDRLEIESRWIVTGTPSQGLFGVDGSDGALGSPVTTRAVDSTNEQERRDLERLGAMAAFYLKIRPWANTSTEHGDRPADWAVYVMRPQHSKRSSGRPSCLQETLDSMIIRHRLAEVSSLLPPVDEKMVYLEGSYQDKLALNLFSMMIIFNSVQSQRTDRDYFFHQTQRKARDELWTNLRQASFFGAVFFSREDITKAVETAESFLEKKKFEVSAEDEALLREAISMGRLALGNVLKGMPCYGCLYTVSNCI